MYIPEHFRETDPMRISALIERNPLGMLVTAPECVPFVSHLPFLFDQSTCSGGSLLCHMARANPQWQHFASASEVLVVFQGPHAYVSPSWYSSPGVPTWNYTVVHVRGKPQLIEDESELESLITRLTHVHESHLSDPWQPDIEGDRRTKLLGMIVGFEIAITDIQAKFKLSQNRPDEDRLQVIEKLGRSNNQTENKVARLMSELTHE